MSDVFLTIERNDDKAERFKKSQECFQAGAKYNSPEIEIISVPCGDDVYEGYFCHPREPNADKWPAVLFLGGADAFAEEIYFGGCEVCERGYAMLLVDTPGRGSSMYVKNIKTRPDYEVPGKACFDYLFSRPEIDPERVALMGISMAGYYAPRVAAYEERIKALIAWCGCYSILDDLIGFDIRLYHNACPYNTIAADGNRLFRDSPTSDKTFIAHSNFSINNGAGGNMAMITNHSIVFNESFVVNYAVITDPSIRIHHGIMQNNGTISDLRMF